MHWYLDVLKKYVVFSGRARRTEFWVFTLISTIISAILNMVDAGMGTSGMLGGVYSLGVLLPSLGVSVRRLHDTGRSGWWLLIGLVPILGWIALIYFCVLDSEPGENKYGPNPKEVAA